MGVRPGNRRCLIPEPVDPEVAAATFSRHLGEFFATGRGRGAEWERIDLDPLHVVIRVPATRMDGTVDHYFVRIGAEFYDVWPPSVAFVRRTDAGDWIDARPGTRWWPNQQNSPGFSFHLHEAYQFPDGSRQLLCFSHSFDYYLSNHHPTDQERWQQGRHTLTATLSRVALVLQAPNYIGPSGDSDS